MTTPLEPLPVSSPTRSRRRRSGWTLRLTPSGVGLLLALDLVLLGLLALGMNKFVDWSLNRLPLSPPITSPLPSVTATLSSTPDEALLVTPIPPSQSSPTAPVPLLESPTPYPLNTTALIQGMILLALDEGSNFHLFAYQPQEAGAGQPIPLTRLTSGPWDDINPALSPDGKRIAFASNRNGYWDLYLLDLPGGVVTRLTDSREYESAPCWSPDGQWLTYESYIDQNLEVMIQSINGPTETIRLTNHPAADHSPAWSPQGRSIAFVSTRSGESEIWLADLDKSEEERFHNLSQNAGSPDRHPVWSPDGARLAWAGERDGFHNLYIWDVSQMPDPRIPPTQPGGHYVGSGDWPAWSPDGETLLTVLLAPNQSYLTAYSLLTPGLVLPPLALPGSVAGLLWGDISLPLPLREPYKQAAQLSPTALYISSLTAIPAEQGDRYLLVELGDVEAPHPLLHDLVNEAFLALRERIANQAGWDFLASLENAYVPLTSPLDPGRGNDWLYTGRAFAFTTVPINAGWLAVVREDFGMQTYWRVYVRARFQDGSAGIPLHDQPWDFGARYDGDASVYEQGGVLLQAALPGYWVDFTQQALAHGWERLAALSTWRASYPAARFNEFTLTNGLDWQTAMLELYPPEVLITPSPVVPPTTTPSPTSRWYQSPTPTFTATPRPTFTPIGPTLTPTRMPSATSSPTPTRPAPTFTRTPSTATPRPTATAGS